MNNLTPQEKRQYLMNKYVKRDYKIEDLEQSRKFAVYFTPNVELVKDWTLLCVCSTNEEALKEILWRKKFHETNDGDLVLDNDDRFTTFRDETKNTNKQGLTYEPGQELMNIDYNSSGNMLQVISNSQPPQQSNNGFKGMAYYTNLETDYKGHYKIEIIYEVS